MAIQASRSLQGGTRASGRATGPGRSEAAANVGTSAGAEILQSDLETPLLVRLRSASSPGSASSKQRCRRGRPGRRPCWPGRWRPGTDPPAERARETASIRISGSGCSESGEGDFADADGHDSDNSVGGTTRSRRPMPLIIHAANALHTDIAVGTGSIRRPARIGFVLIKPDEQDIWRPPDRALERHRT